MLCHEAYQCLLRLERQQEKERREAEEAEAAEVAAKATVQYDEVRVRQRELDARRVRWHKAAWEAMEEEEEEERNRKGEEVNLSQKTAVNNMLKYYMEVDRSKRYASAKGTPMPEDPDRPDPILGKGALRYEDDL